MSKTLLAAFFFVCFQLFCGVAVAVPVPTFEAGKHVYVVRTTADDRVGMSDPTDLEAHLVKLHYPTYVVIFSPGYRTVDMPVIAEQLRQKWEDLPGYDPQKSVVLVYSRFPPWYGVHTPGWYKKTRPNADMPVGRDPIPQMLSFLAGVNLAMAAQDAEVKHQLRIAEDAKATAERAAADKAKAEADRLAAAKAFLQLQVTEFSLREVEAETCCPTEFRDAKNLRGLSTSTEVTGDLASIYELGAKIYKHNRSIDEALLHHQTENRQAAWKMVGWFVLAVILTFVVFWFFTRFEKLRVRLNQLLEKVPDIPEYNGETEKVVLPFRTEFRGYAEELKAMIFTLVEQKGFRFRSPLAFGQLRQQATRLINNVADLLRRWEPINKQIGGRLYAHR